MGYTIADLNQMDQPAFVEVLGAVFEDTPAIAASAWEQRPFADFSSLYQAMTKVVHEMSQTDQLALIRAHPDLGTKAKMAEASVKEQAGVGLDRLSPEEFERFQSLNQRYKDTFGFPFIIAVKNHTKDSILDAFVQRLENTPDQEIATAIAEISKIAYFRLHQLIT